MFPVGIYFNSMIPSQFTEWVRLFKNNCKRDFFGITDTVDKNIYDDTMPFFNTNEVLRRVDYVVVFAPSIQAFSVIDAIKAPIKLSFDEFSVTTFRDKRFLQKRLSDFYNKCDFVFRNEDISYLNFSDINKKIDNLEKKIRRNK